MISGFLGEADGARLCLHRVASEQQPEHLRAGCRCRCMQCWCFAPCCTSHRSRTSSGRATHIESQCGVACAAAWKHTLQAVAPRNMRHACNVSLRLRFRLQCSQPPKRNCWIGSSSIARPTDRPVEHSIVQCGQGSLGRGLILATADGS